MEKIEEVKPVKFVFKNPIKQFYIWFKKQPDKKRLIEFLTALLSVPVMITVILINLNNLNQNKQNTTKEPQTTPIQIVITGGIPQNRPDMRPNDTNNATPTPNIIIATPTPGPSNTPTPAPTSTPFIIIATPTPTPIPSVTVSTSPAPTSRP